jgi:hypothetical protein
MKTPLLYFYQDQDQLNLTAFTNLVFLPFLKI